MPHGKLLLGIPAKGLSGPRIPGPNFIGIEQIQFSSEFPARQIGQAADEVSVDVIGMIFLFHKGTVGEDLSDSDLLQLPGHHFEITDEGLTPGGVPRTVSVARSHDQRRVAKLLEREFVIAWRQQAQRIEGRNI